MDISHVYRPNGGAKHLWTYGHGLVQQTFYIGASLLNHPKWKMMKHAPQHRNCPWSLRGIFLGSLRGFKNAGTLEDAGNNGVRQSQPFMTIYKYTEIRSHLISTHRSPNASLTSKHKSMIFTLKGMFFVQSPSQKWLEAVLEGVQHHFFSHRFAAAISWWQAAIMNRRRNVLWPQMVARHVARQGMMGKVFFFRWGWPYATWTVGCFLIVFRLGFNSSNRTKIEERYHQTFQVPEILCDGILAVRVLVEMATRGISRFISFR